MIINLYAENHSDVEIIDSKPGEIVGYKLNFTKLVKFSKWHIKNVSENELIVLGEKKIASVFDCGDGTYVENWYISYDKKSKLYKFYQSFGTQCWYEEDFIAARIIECFGGLDNLVLSVTPKINDFYSSDEDE